MYEGKTLSEMMDLVRRDYPDHSFSVRKTDENLWVASIKGKDHKVRTVVYLKKNE